MTFSKIAQEASGKINSADQGLAIVLAAGHGKRIRSSLPKVVHPVWGKPSVTRVLEAVNQGLKTKNEVVIVGRQADKVIKILGSKNNRIFAFQKEQLGTGDAVRVGTLAIPDNFKGNVFVLPGDIGLIDQKTLDFFKRNFVKSKANMMLLTGLYEGDPLQNYYGRVVRVPDFDSDGNLADEKHFNQVISIVQIQDILNLPDKGTMEFPYRGKKYIFTRQQLINIKEFDSAIFAFNVEPLKKYITKLSTQNIQKEFYLTDLVGIFNQANLSVMSITPPNHEVLLGFNDKAVWKTIEQVYRKRFYSELRNIIDIEDENRFFIDEAVIKNLIRDDKKSHLDIHIGSGATIGSKVKLGRKISIGANTNLSGNVVVEDGVTLGPQIRIATQDKQKVVIRKNSNIAGNNVIKGQVEIKEGSYLAESVNLTGNNEFPTIIGKGVQLLGSCYLFGTRVDDSAVIESSILIRKKIRRITLEDGTVQPVKFIIPPPVGSEAVRDIG